jgi:Protein of unknown function (DUF2652)
MINLMPPSAANGPLLLVDISGYTSFLQSVAQAHANDMFTNTAVPEAYGMMSSLLDGIVAKIIPPFTLSKLEGDAVFAYATDDGSIPTGAALVTCFATCYADFRARVDAAHDIWTCGCGVCARSTGLDLKFILHAGPFVIQSIAGSRELTGPQVVMAHRLLKSGAADLVGHGAYALITDAAADRFDVGVDGSLALTETYEHYSPIEAHVFPLRDA